MHGSQIIFYNNKTNETKHQKKKNFEMFFRLDLHLGRKPQ
jgi:hypothetical protein